MKSLMLLIALAYYAIHSANAQNRCSSKAFQEKNHCVIAGGTADTNKTVNQGHARSLALKTARFLAYEKIAEKVKGVMLSSSHRVNNGLLSQGKLNTLVEAKLKDLSFEEERLSFLPDGSPWAEVTVSVPKIKLMGEAQEALKYQNGHHQAVNKNSAFIIDARGLKASFPLFFSIVAGGVEIASYNPISSIIKFVGSEGDLDAIENKSFVTATSIEDGKLQLDEDQAKSLRKHLIENKLSSESPIYILK